MLSPSQLQAFDRDGCLLGGRVLSDDQIHHLRAELDRVIREHQSGQSTNDKRPVLVSKWGETEGAIIWQIVNIWQASPAFEKLLYLAPVTTAIAQLTRSPDIQIWHDQIQYKPPRDGGINNWHQDAPYWPVIKPETPVTAWIALDDVDQSNGCMWMVPGSHKWGNHIKMLEENPRDKFFDLGKGFEPPADAETKTVRLVPWPVPAGHVSFHHSMTWHGSHANTSDRPRRAIALHFMTHQARFVASGQHPMKKFINLPDNAPMRDAGEHFPKVVKNNQPLSPP